MLPNKRVSGFFQSFFTPFTYNLQFIYSKKWNQVRIVTLIVTQTNNWPRRLWQCRRQYPTESLITESHPLRLVESSTSCRSPILTSRKVDRSHLGILALTLTTSTG